MKKISLPLLALLLPLFALFAVRAVLSQSQNDPAPLPAPWTAHDVGDVLVPGSSVLADSTYQISASGADPFGAEDAFHFAHQSWNGDALLVARFLGFNQTNRGRAGLMFRSSLDPGAPNVFLAVGSTNRLVLQYRYESDEPSERDAFPTLPTPDAGPQTARSGPARVWLQSTNSPSTIISAPAWLMLIRRGDDFSAFTSLDGANWQWLATERIKMPPLIQVGLAVNGFKAAALATARFDHLSLQPPAPTNTAAFLGVGQGLACSFTETATTNTIQRTHPTINFDPGRFAPFIRTGSFSITFEGYLEPQFSEPYNLQLVHGNCARLWLNGDLLIDDCQSAGGHQAKIVTNLVAGRKYPLRLECLDQSPRDVVRLLWSSPSTPLQTIPQTQLYSPSHPAVITGTNVPAAGIPIDLSLGLEALELADRLPQLPAPWLARILGALTNAGSVQPVTGNALLARGAGNGLGRAPDESFFTYQPWNGDAEIIARITPASNESSSPTARAGLMIRADLSPDAPTVFLQNDARGRTRFLFRKRLGAAQFLPPGHAALPWLKLSRRGDDFFAFSSSDGLQWDWLGSVTVPMPARIFVGFAVGSSDPDQPHQARFDNLQLAAPAALTRSVGSGDGLSANYSDLVTGARRDRIDPEINFFWGPRTRYVPILGIGRTNFLVTWEGLLEAQFSQPCRLHVISDEPVLLWFDGKPLFNGIRPNGAVEQRADLQLRAGHRYPIRLEYQHSAGIASRVRLLWSGPGTPKKPVPQSQFYSRDNPAFTEIPDKDHDGMPDAWELAHGLDPLDASDASADPDHDGLSNLDEFLAGTDPQNPDTDADHLLDGWELAHNLNPLDPSDAPLDPDHDGLSNLQEFIAGTDPFNPDTDGDGLPDGLELNDSATNPLVPDTSAIETVFETAGTNAVAHLGQWAPQGTAVFALDGRGALEYILNVPQPGMFRLELLGGSHNSWDPSAEFELLAWIDGESLGRSTLAAPHDPVGRVPRPGVSSVYFLTPWLKSGNHRLRIYWDNARWRRSFQLAAVRLQSLQGPDADTNNIPDWIDKRLASLCSVDLASNSSAAVSPACIEGRGSYLTMMNIRGGVTPQHGPSNRWFANIPLSPSTATTVICSFQNDALHVTNRITWRPTNLLQPTNLLLRAGDSLLLGAMPPNATNGQMLLTIPGVTNYSAPAGQPVPHQFPAPGIFTLIGTYIAPSGQSITRTSSVTVVSAVLGPDPAAWVAKLRAWDVSLDPALTLNADPQLHLENFGSPTPGITELGLATDHPDDRFLVARIATNGPILTNIVVEGFRLFSGYETAVRRLDSFPDGSELVEMGLVLSPLRTNLIVQIDVLVGGVTFDDGTLTRTIPSADFNELGQAFVRFIRPPTFKTSVCHTTRIYQGPTLLGIYP